MQEVARCSGFKTVSHFDAQVRRGDGHNRTNYRLRAFGQGNSPA